MDLHDIGTFMTGVAVGVWLAYLVALIPAGAVG